MGAQAKMIQMRCVHHVLIAQCRVGAHEFAEDVGTVKLSVGTRGVNSRARAEREGLRLAGTRRGEDLLESQTGANLTTQLTAPPATP